MKLRRAKAEAARPIQLPPRSETVILSTAAGGKIPARVLESAGQSLVIAIVVPIKPFTAPELESLVVEYASPRGRVRLTGTFQLEDPADPDVLRLEGARSVEILQQREYVRIRSARPVVVYAGGEGREVQSFTIDLSGGGFLLAGPDSLKVGDELRFQLTVTPGALPIIGKGKVARIDSAGRRAICFEEISDLDRRRLVRFIFECQRAERRRGLQSDNGNGG